MGVHHANQNAHLIVVKHDWCYVLNSHADAMAEQSK